MPLRTILCCGSTLKIVHMQLFLRPEGEYKKKPEQCFWMILGAMFLPILDLFALPECELTSLFSFEVQPQTCFHFKFREIAFMHRGNSGANEGVEFGFQNVSYR